MRQNFGKKVMYDEIFEDMKKELSDSPLLKECYMALRRIRLVRYIERKVHNHGDS